MTFIAQGDRVPFEWRQALFQQLDHAFWFAGGRCRGRGDPCQAGDPVTTIASA
jgi:hypothetical protein